MNQPHAQLKGRLLIITIFMLSCTCFHMVSFGNGKSGNLSHSNDVNGAGTLYMYPYQH